MQLPGLNFQLGDDIDALRDAVRDFAQAEIAPLAADIVASRPEEMQALINAERERFGRVIPDMKIKLV